MTIKQRVAVTGIGIVSPCGIGVERFWKSLVDRESGIKEIHCFDTGELKSRIAGEIRDFNVQDYISRGIKVKRTARHTQLALAATALALMDAGLETADLRQPAAIPIIIGVSTVAHDLFNPNVDKIYKKGLQFASPHLIKHAIPNAIVSTIAEWLGIDSVCTTISNGCPSGLDAIAAAAETIRSGQTDIAIAGGADAPIAAIPFGCFDITGLSSRENRYPEKASRPFDICRDTGVISEGAGIVILENLDSALARGTTPDIEVSGYGSHVDVDSDRGGSGLEFAIIDALANAGRRPLEVDYICAHGSGHRELDRIETDIIRKIFQEHAYAIPVSSIKGVTGNPLAAAGPFQVAASALSVRHSTIPPTANCDIVDPYCDLDYVMEGPRFANPSKIVINTHGVTGNNSCLYVEKIV